MLRRGLPCLLTLMVLPGVMLLPVWMMAGLGANEDDVLYYLPSRTLLHDFAQEGVLPWLNPWNGLDRPFLADPQSAVFYPLSLLFVWLPPLIAYPASLWVHYSLGLLGMLRLLRAEKLGRAAAWFGAIAFAFSGTMLAHRAHLTFVHSAAWTPWIFWRLDRYVQRGGSWRLAIAAALILLQCLAGHVQVAALTALGSLVWLIGRDGWSAVAARRWLAAWAAAAGLFAIQWVPTLLYVLECTRTQRGYLDFTENSWNPLSAVGLVLPMFFGQRVPNFFDTPYWGPSHQVEQFAYAGIVTLLLALPMLRAERRADARVRGDALLAGFGVLLALGLYGPICPVLYWLPGASLFRVPARAMLLLNLSLAALAARAIHELHAPATPQRARLRAVLLAWTSRPVMRSVGLVALLVLPFALALPLAPGALRASIGWALRPWSPALWVPLCVLVVSLATVNRVVRRWRQPVYLLVLPALLAVDLGIIGWSIDVPPRWKSPNEMLNPPERIAWLRHVAGSDERLWVVTRRADGKPGEYVRPLERGVANTNILNHVAALTNYGPLQPRHYVDYFGFEPWGEQPNPDPLLRDTDWMASCNVGWVLLCDANLPAPSGGLPIETTPGGLRLYRIPFSRGDVFVADATIPHAIQTVHETPYSFTTRIALWPEDDAVGGDGPDRVRVVASRLAQPGWAVRVNGQRWACTAADDLLLGVDLRPPEVVEIAWRYAPPGLLAGAAISGLSVLLLGAAGLRGLFHPARE